VILRNILVTTTLLFLVSGCGGGGTSTSEPLPVVIPAPNMFMGVFLDSAVQGLNYRTTSQTGTTNAEGEFIFQQDELVIFSIGDIDFPQVDAQVIMTPFEIFNVTSIENISVINLARLLQSLDIDGDPANGIVIGQMAHSSAMNMSVDFAAADFDEQVEQLVANSGSVITVLIDATQAIEHLQLLNPDESSNDNDCSSTHSMVGYTGNFANYQHGIQGTATILDDCTIQIDNFSYDGGGPAVYFYAALNQDYNGVDAFQVGTLLSGTNYNSALLTITLPQGKTLDDFNSLSVWCVDFSVNFGDLEFTSP